jgi:hypothetical protein
MEGAVRERGEPLRRRDDVGRGDGCEERFTYRADDRRAVPAGRQERPDPVPVPRRRHRDVVEPVRGKASLGHRRERDGDPRTGGVLDPRRENRDGEGRARVTVPDDHRERRPQRKRAELLGRRAPSSDDRARRGWQAGAPEDERRHERPGPRRAARVRRGRARAFRHSTGSDWISAADRGAMWKLSKYVTTPVTEVKWTEPIFPGPYCALS